ncbi:MAG: class I adenylate-forming enzyme family protein, partial [Burkholderiaceae bacterium]
MEHNLADTLAQHARARPDHTALVDGERALTHAELHDRVLTLAQSLLSNGLQAGDILGLCLRDSLEHVVCMWACVRAGLVMLPLDYRWTSGEREAVARHFQASAVICEPGVTFSACATLSWAQLQTPSSVVSATLLPSTTLASPLLISLSSGTTGRPKGPMITHRHFLRRFHTHWISLGLNANSRYVNATPLYFGGGRTFVLSVLFSGGTVILHAPPFEPESLAQVVQQHDANALFLVPTQLRRLLACPPAVRASFARLQTLISSGAPLQPNERSAIRADLCPRFYEYYASTEGGGVTLCTPEDFDRHLTSVGRAIYGVEVGIVDASDAPVGRGLVGHLRYRGPGVADAFFNDPEQTRQHFRDGWFYPGDLAQQDAQGYLYLRGRSNDTVIRGGVNIYPSEVEATLMQLPRLLDCSVFGIADADLGERLACAWVGESELTLRELETHCRNLLTRYKVPSVWLRLDELPRNSAGKVLKSR